MELAHETLLALAYVSQITDPDAVRARFIESLNRLTADIFRFEYVECQPEGLPEARVFPIATLRESFGFAIMTEGVFAEEAERAVLRNAFQFLAVLLENRQNEQILQSKYQSLQRAISQEKSMLRTVLDALPVGVWVTDANGVILLGNVAGRGIWGGIRYVGPEGYEEYRAWWTKAGRPVERDEWPVVRVLASGQTVGDEEIAIEGFDGTRKTVLASAAPIVNDEGALIGAVAVNQDITERFLAERAVLESEEQFKAMFDMASIGMTQTEPSTGRLLRVNRKLCEMTGYSAEELLALRFVDFTHPDDRERDWAAYRRVMRGETSDLSIEKRYVHKNGSTVWARLNMTILRDAEGRPWRGMSAIEDITHRKHAEEERARLQDQLAQLQKMESVGRLAGGVAHDFNNTLGIILGYADMALESAAKEDPIYAHLEEIRRAAERSAGLTHQLLTFASRQTASPKVLDVNATVEGTLKMLHRVMGEDIDLRWRPAESLWPVNIDPTQLDRILVNLCVNARDAISGVGKITIETHNAVLDEDYCARHMECDPGEYVSLIVSDDGCGMEKEVLDRIFEPFFTTKGAEEGTGLGLAAVYGIVKQNGGLIDVRSEPGVGTMFKIFLPRHTGDVAVAGERNASHARGGAETVLVVEDEPAILNLVRLMLQGGGYHVLAAGTPFEAIRLAEAHAGEIDLLLTDVVMPEMNGRDMAARILDSQPEIKCLFMSGYTADHIVNRDVLDAEVHIIEKPFGRERLVARVREILDKE